MFAIAVGSTAGLSRPELHQAQPWCLTQITQARPYSSGRLCAAGCHSLHPSSRDADWRPSGTMAGLNLFQNFTRIAGVVSRAPSPAGDHDHFQSERR